ncbi:MAG: response regulator [Bryobacterales bacterium]|nr:response regulator [Bryobacterales bacterium]
MFEIMLVEDDAGDLRLIREALRDVTLPVHLNVLTDGEQAMEFLRRRETVCPSLIVLDLNLPKITGDDVLRKVKSDEDLRTIPVVVFSSSRSPAQIAHAYQLGANGYVCKPQELEEFLGATRTIVEFWGSLAALPSQNSSHWKRHAGESGREGDNSPDSRTLGATPSHPAG